MKNLFVTGLILLTLLGISCHKEDINPEKPKGTLSVNIGLFIGINEVENNLKSTFGVEDFAVTIFTAAGEQMLTFEKASEMPGQIELESGQYYVTANSGNNLPAAFDNPYYYGESSLFTITPGTQQSISVNCELGNTMINIVYSDQVRNLYTDFNTTVSSSAGTLTFTRDETRTGYFQILPLEILVVLGLEKSDGTWQYRTLIGNLPDPQPRKRYQIHVDASAPGGSAGIHINLDESVDPVEIVYLTDDQDNTDSGILKAGDLLITEIMYDPSVLSDTEGEWFEIYNSTNLTVDLQNLVIRKNDTERHVINRQILLPSHQYYVLARSEGAVSGYKYVYGSAISLNNTGAILSLSNFGSDGTNGSVICAVDYQADGFPSATGASLSLSPLRLNYSQSLLGESWCMATSPFSGADLGTPGSQNDACN